MKYFIALNTARHKSVKEQQLDRFNIIEDFREWIKTNPSEFEFGQMMKGVVLFPEMLHILFKSK